MHNCATKKYSFLPSIPKSIQFIKNRYTHTMPNQFLFNTVCIEMLYI